MRRIYVRIRHCNLKGTGANAVQWRWGGPEIPYNTVSIQHTIQNTLPSDHLFGSFTHGPIAWHIWLATNIGWTGRQFCICGFTPLKYTLDKTKIVLALNIQTLIFYSQATHNWAIVSCYATLASNTSRRLLCAIRSSHIHSHTTMCKAWSYDPSLIASTYRILCSPIPCTYCIHTYYTQVYAQTARIECICLEYLLHGYTYVQKLN